jgi:RNA polymerase sigma factor (sigma-70 family)
MKKKKSDPLLGYFHDLEYEDDYKDQPWEVSEIIVEHENRTEIWTKSEEKGNSSDNELSLYNGIKVLGDAEQAKYFEKMETGRKELAAAVFKLLVLDDENPGSFRKFENIYDILEDFCSKFVTLRAYSSLEKNDISDLDLEEANLEEKKAQKDADEFLIEVNSIWADLSSRVNIKGSADSNSKELDASIEKFSKALAKLDSSIIVADVALKASVKEARAKGYVGKVAGQNAISEISRAKLNWVQARNGVVEGNIPLVRKLARKLKYRNVSMCDLVNAGAMGLMKAVAKFDASRGFKLSTYAVWDINQALDSVANAAQKQLNTPDYVLDNKARIATAENKYYNLYGEEPTDEVLAELTNMDSGSVKNAKEAQVNLYSLDYSIGDENETSAGDLVPLDTDSPEEIAILKDMDEKTKGRLLITLKKTLTTKEYNVIVRHFGLESFSEEMSQIEIANDLNCSKQYISQVLKRALNKLQKSEDASLLYEEIVGRRAS